MLFFGLLLFACSGTPGSDEPGRRSGSPLEVKTLSWPVHWLVEQIGGDRVDASCILPYGEDPGHWQPTAAQVAAFADADLVVANGAGYEAWLTNVSIPSSVFLDSSKGLTLRPTKTSRHTHGDEGSHHHQSVDPHTWMDPQNFSRQASAVYTELLARDARREALYTADLEGVLIALSALDEDFGYALGRASDHHIASNQPVFDYLAARYEFTIRAFDIDPSSPPSAETIAAVEAWVQASGPAPLMLWNQMPADGVAEAFPRALRHAVLDPLTHAPGSDQPYRYVDQARSNLAQLRALLQRQ